MGDFFTAGEMTRAYITVEEWMAQSIITRYKMPQSELKYVLQLTGDEFSHNVARCQIGGSHVDYAPGTSREVIIANGIKGCKAIAATNYTIPSNASKKLKEIYAHYLDIKKQAIQRLKDVGETVPKPKPTPKPEPPKKDSPLPDLEGFNLFLDEVMKPPYIYIIGVIGLVLVGVLVGRAIR